MACPDCERLKAVIRMLLRDFPVGRLMELIGPDLLTRKEMEEVTRVERKEPS